MKKYKGEDDLDLQDVEKICSKMECAAQLNILNREYPFNFESKARKMLNKLMFAN